jgi:GxxExxY protein
MTAPDRKVTTPYDDLTYRIIGCSMTVHRNLGPALREDSYQRALALGLEEAGLSFEAQKIYSVFDSPDQQQLVGYYIPDFLVEEKIVLEIKALRGLDNSHLAQVIGYLAVSGCPLGLLVNFGERSLRHRRIFPPNKIGDHLINHQWLFVPEWLKP